ncbi:extracellular solute-binding protein [Paenibacillus spongiae]|uniref:Extracellular solute-binding protein n=1 Tax=Paenibacillus spongiae TaxID=2909671 RepID=A0ABY5S379_9BACL|nr:extracellular solute-binding protein [Paenibacillus spongiae]UVI28342.1 extracellular solute-binding protein [Paenibacillus spongiae]
MVNRHPLRILLLILLSIVTITGCSSNSNSGSESPPAGEGEQQNEEEAPVKDKESFVADIKLLRTWGSDEQFKLLLEDFNKEYPNIKVEVLPQPYNELPALIAAGTIPDVVGMVGTMPEWVENGVLEDLSSYIEVDPDVNPDTFHEVAYTRSVTPDGKVWALPWQVDPNFAIMYNTTILDEFGITEIPDLNSLSAFGDFLRKFWVVRDGKQEMATFSPHETYGAVNSVQTWAYLNGATTKTFYDPETRKVNFNDPLIVEALEWIVQFKRDNVDDERRGQVQASLPEGTSWFQAGKSAMNLQTAGELRLNYEMNPDEIGIISMPQKAVWIGGWSFALTAGGKNKEAAWEFLKWMCATNEGAESNLKHLTAISGKKENPYLDEQAKTDPVYAAFKEVLGNAQQGHLWTAIPVEWAPEFDTKYAEVMNGTLEPKAFLDHMTKYIQALVDERYSR